MIYSQTNRTQEALFALLQHSSLTQDERIVCKLRTLGLTHITISKQMKIKETTVRILENRVLTQLEGKTIL